MLLGVALLVGHGTIVPVGAATLTAGSAVASLGRRALRGRAVFPLVALAPALPRILPETIDWPPHRTTDMLEVPWVIAWLLVVAALLGTARVGGVQPALDRRGPDIEPFS